MTSPIVLPSQSGEWASALSSLGGGIKHVLDPNAELREQIKQRMLLDPNFKQQFANAYASDPAGVEKMLSGGMIGGDKAQTLFDTAKGTGPDALTSSQLEYKDLKKQVETPVQNVSPLTTDVLGSLGLNGKNAQNAAQADKSIAQEQNTVASTEQAKMKDYVAYAQQQLANKQPFSRQGYEDYLKQRHLDDIKTQGAEINLDSAKTEQAKQKRLAQYDQILAGRNIKQDVMALDKGTLDNKLMEAYQNSPQFSPVFMEYLKELHGRNMLAFQHNLAFGGSKQVQEMLRMRLKDIDTTNDNLTAQLRIAEEALKTNVLARSDKASPENLKFNSISQQIARNQQAGKEWSDQLSYLTFTDLIKDGGHLTPTLLKQYEDIKQQMGLGKAPPPLSPNVKDGVGLVDAVVKGEVKAEEVIADPHMTETDKAQILGTAADYIAKRNSAINSGPVDMSATQRKEPPNIDLNKPAGQMTVLIPSPSEIAGAGKSALGTIGNAGKSALATTLGIIGNAQPDLPKLDSLIRAPSKPDPNSIGNKILDRFIRNPVKRRDAEYEARKKREQ